MKPRLKWYRAKYVSVYFFICFSAWDPQIKRRRSLQGPAGSTLHWRLSLVVYRDYLRLHDTVSDCLISIVINSTAACTFSCADSMKVMAVIHQDRNDWMLHLRMILRTAERWLQIAQTLWLNDIKLNQWLISLICTHFNIFIMIQWKLKIV